MTTEKKPHPHAAMIAEWIKDINRPVEVRAKLGIGDTWETTTHPVWLHKLEYRFKPEIKKYRVALCRTRRDKKPYTLTTDTALYANTIPDQEWFVRWLTDWIEYEV